MFKVKNKSQKQFLHNEDFCLGNSNDKNEFIKLYFFQCRVGLRNSNGKKEFFKSLKTTENKNTNFFEEKKFKI